MRRRDASTARLPSLIESKDTGDRGMECGGGRVYDRNMLRGHRHQRPLSVLAFGLLALVAELAGRSLTHRIDVGRHVASPGNTRADYYPILLAFVKGGIALLLARLAWRLVRARATERAGRRLLTALGTRSSGNAPRVQLRLSLRLVGAFFAVFAVIYLVQVDAEGLSAGRWPLLAPWLHSSALPVFAVLAVFAALAWRAVAQWLCDYESYAEATVAHARRIASSLADRPTYVAQQVELPPRRLFGIAFESRPPPLTA
jgi:hypothetical protein